MRLALFLLLSLVIVGFSWRALRNPRAHGFYRFFAFEGLLLLLLLNLPYWLHDPVSPTQLLSWSLLALSLIFVLEGVRLLHRIGGQRKVGTEENFAFENTAELVTEGLYRYIRHPMYASLLLLTWGTLLKHPSLFTLTLASAISLFIVLTARCEEHENVAYFGYAYRVYMTRTRMFIPFLF